MAQQEKWLSDILKEASEEVNQWPEWKRSDDVQRELRKLAESKREVSGDAPTPSVEPKR